ncbi:hypothetical protein [uncultured Sphingomonas sp.]|uniref:hypothetical protein n=1 Tax=uncultured Sphingomonas sp. TaxID=158754 RepID=UPI0025D11BD9|nr:hypothetical protein [uncultured Sphingomonas sp.]
MSEAATAEGKVVQLEGNAARLSALRSSLIPATGQMSGASLANTGELGQRLDSVREGLTSAINAARVTASARADERRDADIARESAERLQTRAVADLQRMIEDRMMAGIRPRNGKDTARG